MPMSKKYKRQMVDAVPVAIRPPDFESMLDELWSWHESKEILEWLVSASNYATTKAKNPIAFMRWKLERALETRSLI